MTTATVSTAIEPRPKTATREMKHAAAERTVDSLISHGHLAPAERADSIESLAKVGERYMDGYQIAKRLDDWSHWDCDLEMAEDLDSFPGHLDDELRKAEQAWFDRTQPQPPFPVGARIAFGRDSVGVIDSVYDHGPAKYAVKVDGDGEADTPTCRRSIVNFEDVRAV